MSKVQKSPSAGQSPRNHLPKETANEISAAAEAQEKTVSNNNGAGSDDETKIENGNSDEMGALKTSSPAKAKPETSKRKLGEGDDDEDEEFFGFELGPLKDSNKVKKMKDMPATGEATLPVAGGSAAKNAMARPITDPIYQEPFKHGWKRELVLRSDSSSHKMGDVYYISPTGKRLRNRGELSSFLRGDVLSPDAFVFAKETIGGPPEQDFIRQAVPKAITPARKSVAPIPVASPLFPDPNIDLGKRKPKPKLPKGASPEPPSNPPRKRVNRSPSTSSSAGSRTPQAKQNENDVPKPGKVSRNKTTTSGFTACSIDCLLAMGTIPQLQCQQCTSLYHAECVGASKLQAALGNYVCKACANDDQTLMDHLTPLPTQKYAPSAFPEQLFAPHAVASPKSMGSLSRKRASVHEMPIVAPPTPLVFNDNTPPQTIATVGGRKYIVVMKKKDPAQKNQAKKVVQPITGSPAPTSSSDDSKRSSSRSSRVTPKSPPFAGTSIGKPPLSEAVKSPSLASKSTTSISPKNSKKPTSPAASTSSAMMVAAALPQPRFATNFFSNVSIGYDVLFHTFQYLKVQELLRASCVCRLWNQTANHPMLWRTVRMKNSQVNDWAGLASTLRRNSTSHLDLRKMLAAGGDEMWQQFSENIGKIENLESIELCRCSTSIVERLFESNPNIRAVNAMALRDDTINLERVVNLKQLQELRLRANDGLNLETDLQPLAALTELKHLSLTFVNKLNEKSVGALKALTNLESLELGECNDFPVEFATEVLPALVRLERLRLEKGQQECCTFEILGAIAQLPKMAQLELINFDIKMEFDEHIAKCINLRKFLLIPTYVSQSAATNNMVLKGLISLSASLQIFVWGVTQELLKVTELYVDQCDDKTNKKPPPPGESIPILKPVPGQEDTVREPVNIPSDIPAQVEIVPLATVESILHKAMPETKIKITKVPFVNTWRQTMVDLQ